MSGSDTVLDKDKILSTPARRKLYKARLEGKNIKDAAKIAGLRYNYARELCCGLFRNSLGEVFKTDTGINALVRAEQAKIEAKTAEKLEITEASQVKRFQELSQGAEHKGQYSAAVSAEDRISTICGLYERDHAQKRQELAVAVVYYAQPPAGKALTDQTEPNLSENADSMINSAQAQSTQGVTDEPNEAEAPGPAGTPHIVGQDGAE